MQDETDEQKCTSPNSLVSPELLRIKYPSFKKKKKSRKKKAGEATTVDFQWYQINFDGHVIDEIKAHDGEEYNQMEMTIQRMRR